jgi:hypothetical protein
MAKSAPAKKAAAKKAVAPKRTPLTADPRETAAAEEVKVRPETAADKQQVDDGTDTILPRRVSAGKKKADEVEVTVIKAFRITDHAGEHKYGVGTYSMPKEHAEHWYAAPHLAGADE